MTTDAQEQALHPAIVSGYANQLWAKEIADTMNARFVQVTRKQFDDREIQTTIEESVRGQDVVVVASSSGDPNKQEKEARLLMRAARRAGARYVSLLLPYMWYGRSDDVWDERQAPALTDTIEGLRQHCRRVIIADPHNALVTQEKFLDAGSKVEECTIVHFAYNYAIQLQHLVQQGLVDKENILFAHADAGSTKRISRSFRACLYNVLGIEGNPNQDDWPQGLKDRDKATNKSKYKGFSADVKGKDVFFFEDMIASGGTARDFAALLKNMGARSVCLCVTSGLFTVDIKKKQPVTTSVEKLAHGAIDAVFVTDTYDYRLTDPVLQAAIDQSQIVHVIKTAPYFAALLKAMHVNNAHDKLTGLNSVSTLKRGTHPEQTKPDQKVAAPTKIKTGCPLLSL